MSDIFLNWRIKRYNLITISTEFYKQHTLQEKSAVPTINYVIINS